MILSNCIIVSVPEIGEDLPEKNPLLQNDGFPEFNNITIENCMAAIGKQTLDFENDVKGIEEKILNNPDSDIFKDVFDPLEKLGAPLDMTWGVSKTLYLGNSTLMPTKSYMAIHDRAKRARASKFNSRIIYNACTNELKKNEHRTEEEMRLIKKFHLEGTLNGLHVDLAQKEALKENMNKLTVERAKFKTKLDFATKKFTHVIRDANIVRDFPIELLKTMSDDPSNYMTGPWKVTLQPQIYMPVMEYCPDSNIRWNMWQAMVNRCSGYNDKETTTSINMEEIRFFRRQQAKILGYKSYAEMSMETKMAGSIENVQNTLHKLLEYARPAQEKELEDLLQFASERGFEGSRIQLWDLPYWRRKQKMSLFKYNDEQIKEYFPLNNVLNGLFEMCENMFNITIKQRANVSTWYKDVKYYDIFEPHSSPPVAGFYIDPYARSEDKLRQNNGWMVGLKNKSEVADTTPLVALIFNFDPPTTDKPTCLTVKELELLFNKFGHSLQHLLCRCRYSEVAGLSNIEWDAVDVCGNVFSNWLYNKNVISNISSHIESEDKLPGNLYDAMVNARKQTAGLDLCRELYLSALDLELHSTKDFWLDIVKRLWPEYRCFPLDKLDSHPCSFTQIFYEEWAAAYFSHGWSRLIAADVYSAFHESQNDNEQLLDVGKRFRETYLSLGGSLHSSEIFRKFRGRDPSPKALLKSLGLKISNSDNGS